MNFPKADEKTKDFFLSVLPDDPRVEIKPMFGHLSAFVNGNMFAGFFGSDLMVKLPGGEREKMLREEGASLFEPMGRVMKEYILLPKSWRENPAKVRQVILHSMETAASFPGKTPKKKAKRDAG
jgi:TfoX/Sxy family transcriptional regulator of competence genes